MEIELESGRRNVLILRLSGTINFFHLQKFRKTLEDLKAKAFRRRRLILDLTSLVHLDALVLGTIVAFARSFRDRGGEIRIVGVQSCVKSLFEESRLSKVYEMYANVEEAERSFQ